MSFWDDFKNFTKPYAADDDYDDFEDETEGGEYEEETPAPRASRRETPSFTSESVFNTPVSSPAPTFTPSTGSTTASSVSSGFSGSIVGSSVSGKQQLVLVRPETFNDATAIAENLLVKKGVVLNLEGIETGLARRVVDFLSGCTYCLKGTVKKISSSTYVFCPSTMEILGDLKNLQGEVENYV